MSTQSTRAQWKGTLKEGQGTMSFTGYEGGYTFASRFEDGEGTNPEELIGAAYAGCFSMYLSLLLTEEGLTPENIDTVADVTLDNDNTGPYVADIGLSCKVKCEGLDEGKLQELVATTKEKCPVSRLYFGGTAKISVQSERIQ